MQAYSGFAAFYDLFMGNVPYDDWTEFIVNQLYTNNIHKGLVLDLGCGTGSMTRRLADKGFDMIGIDISEDMLAIAREKSIGREDGILYICQDMRNFELYGTVAAIICLCDTMNYMLEEEDLLQVFTLANNYLDSQGLFIFDMDTLYAYEEVMADSVVAENHAEGSFIWENTYYEESSINEVDLTIFIKESEYYRKYEEKHYRRGYSVSTIKQLIEKAGMEWIGAYDSLTGKAYEDDSERIYIIAREKYNENKLYLGQ